MVRVSRTPTRVMSGIGAKATSNQRRPIGC